MQINKNFPTKKVKTNGAREYNSPKTHCAGGQKQPVLTSCFSGVNMNVYGAARHYRPVEEIEKDGGAKNCLDG